MYRIYPSFLTEAALTKAISTKVAFVYGRIFIRPDHLESIYLTIALNSIEEKKQSYDITICTKVIIFWLE